MEYELSFDYAILFVGVTCLCVCVPDRRAGWEANGRRKMTIKNDNCAARGVRYQIELFFVVRH